MGRMSVSYPAIGKTLGATSMTPSFNLSDLSQIAIGALAPGVPIPLSVST